MRSGAACAGDGGAFAHDLGHGRVGDDFKQALPLRIVQRPTGMQDAMDVQLEDNEFRVHLKYEKREPLIENLDLVVHFDKDFRVRTP